MEKTQVLLGNFTKRGWGYGFLDGTVTGINYTDPETGIFSGGSNQQSRARRVEIEGSGHISGYPNGYYRTYMLNTSNNYIIPYYRGVKVEMWVKPAGVYTWEFQGGASVFYRVPWNGIPPENSNNGRPTLGYESRVSFLRGSNQDWIVIMVKNLASGGTENSLQVSYTWGNWVHLIGEHDYDYARTIVEVGNSVYTVQISSSSLWTGYVGFGFVSWVDGSEDEYVYFDVDLWMAKDYELKRL